jgi:hypothetical protein
MKISKTMLIVGAVAAVAIAATFGVRANAQPAASEHIVGYSVYAHSHYVLLQRADGTMRTCLLNRQTALNRAPRWECNNAPALP